MPLVLDGTNGVSGVDGTASNPAIEGTDSNTGIFYPAADTVAIGTGGTEALRVNSSQNVGIGTQSPTTILNIEKSAPSASVDILVRNTGTDGTSNARIMSFVSSASGGDPKIGVGITGVQDYFWYIDNSDSDKLKLDSNGSDLITVTSGGNVGIGTTSPVSRLAVNLANTAFSPSQTAAIGSSNATRAQFTAAEPGVMLTTDINGSGTQTGSSTISMGMQIGLYNTNDIRNQIWWSGGYPLTFTYSGTPGASPTERARIDTSGNLLVGKTSTSDTVVGVSISPAGAVAQSNAASTNATVVSAVYSTGASNYRFYVGMGGTVYATSTTITAISDQRLKENIQDIDAGLEKILELKPRKFDWKEGKGKDKKGDRGWIAQEFEQVFPEMIDTWLDPAPEGEEPYKAVNADLIPVLVKALQELNAKVEAQAAAIAALKGNA